MSNFSPPAPIPTVPTSVNILKALRKRGPTKPNPDPRVGDFENLRSLSIWTGEIFPQQITILKRGALLIGESHVTLGIDRDNQLVTFSFKEPVTDQSQIYKLQQLTQAALGPGWCAKMIDNDSGTVGKRSKNFGAKRARGRKKTRKRRK